MPDPPTDSVRLADWIELELLAGESVFVSADEVAQQLKSDPPDYVDTTDGAQLELAIAETVESAFRELGDRERFLRERYPLQIDSGVAESEDGSPCERTYRFLVLVRARQMYSGPIREDDGVVPGLALEELAAAATRAYLHGEGVRFGVAAGVRGGGLPQELPAAAQELARMMREAPHLEVTGQGDRGGDAVAWLPFGDGHPGQAVLVCQATIAESDWMDKQISPKWWNRRLVKFAAAPVPAAAFAESLSLYPPEQLAIAGRIPFDRLRIASLVDDEEIPAEVRARMETWCSWARTQVPR